MRNSVKRSRHTAAGLALLALLGITWIAGGAQAQNDRFTRTSMRVPDRSDEGNWDGTWWYVNRDSKMALWIRTVDGRAEVRFQYHNLNAPETFVTDWEGVAAYTTHNGAGNFSLQCTERDLNTIKADWDWTFVVGRTARQQRGKVTMYRVGPGRQMVVYFDSFAHSIGATDEERWQTIEQSWTFRKASRRLVRWDELPF